MANDISRSDILDLYLESGTTSSASKITPAKLQLKRGRAILTYEASSSRSQRRKASKIKDAHTTPELVHAASLKYSSKGEKKTAEIITKAPQIVRHKLFEDPPPPVVPYQKEEALAFLLEHHVSKRLYKALRKEGLERNACLYPSYHQLLEAKKDSYPRDIFYSETKCEVQVQSLLDQTAKKILASVNLDDNEYDLCLFSKWGFDGSSSQASYKQKWESQTVEENDDEDLQTPSPSDENFFLTSLVPLRLIDVKTNEILWKNPKPNSTRFCRPIRLQFLKETTDVLKNEQEYIENQINVLTQYHFEKCTISYNMSLTMVDGKAINAMNDVSATNCFICKLPLSKFDGSVDQPVNSECLQYGLSVLHAYIKIFECVLHIAYRIGINEWRITKDLKKKFQENKDRILTQLEKGLHIKADRPKQGSGSSNDGNMARTFFRNPHLAAELTGFDDDLLLRFAVILNALSRQEYINVEKFAAYTKATEEKYKATYGWYHMPPTLHKILVHGALVIEHSLLPIGELSEEAQEATNKFVRKFRRDSSRKFSRKQSISDVFNRLLLFSCPYLSQLRINKDKKANESVVHRDVLEGVCGLLEDLEDGEGIPSDEEDILN